MSGVETADLTARTFSAYAGSTFTLEFDDGSSLGLELIRVDGPSSAKDGGAGPRPFSLFFRGPLESVLPQATYPLHHELLGELAIFIVPVERTSEGIVYQAVFN
jgi:hypothetical protein